MPKLLHVNLWVWPQSSPDEPKEVRTRIELADAVVEACTMSPNQSANVSRVRPNLAASIDWESVIKDLEGKRDSAGRAAAAIKRYFSDPGVARRIPSREGE